MPNAQSTYPEQLEALLRDMGTHSLEDVKALIADGQMQSWVEGDTWIVTHVLNFPQATVVEVFIGVGRMADIKVLEKKIEAWARSIGATVMRIYGRTGFWYLGARKNMFPGWRQGPTLYFKRLDEH